jgi:hypothetical protein
MLAGAFRLQMIWLTRDTDHARDQKLIESNGTEGEHHGQPRKPKKLESEI